MSTCQQILKKGPRKGQPCGLKLRVAGGCRDCDRFRCEHGKQKPSCSICFKEGYIKNSVGCRARRVLTNVSNDDAVILLGLDINSYCDYLESTFEPGMTWSNYGSYWSIDHVRPLKAGKISYFDLVNRLHYTNTIACKSIDNQKKSSKEESYFYENPFE